MRDGHRRTGQHPDLSGRKEAGIPKRQEATVDAGERIHQDSSPLPRLQAQVTADSQKLRHTAKVHDTVRSFREHRKLALVDLSYLSQIHLSTPNRAHLH